MGVPQGSIDFLINDFVLFLLKTFWSNYKDDQNLYSTGKDINLVKETLYRYYTVVTE